MLKQITIHPLVKQLTLREYLPATLSLISWALIGLAAGHADAVRLFAANIFIQAARALGTLEVVQVLASRIGAERSVYKASRRLALRLDLVGLATCWLFIGTLATFLYLRGMEVAAVMLAVGSLGLPARHPGSVFVAKRERSVTWRVGAAVTAALGGAVVLAFGLSWLAAAAVLALRDWGGLFATVRFGAPRKPPKLIASEPIGFREAAARTEASARQRLGYRMVKSLFGVILGPFGNFAARTGRGAARIDTRIARLMPRHWSTMALFTAGMATAAAVLLLSSSEPAALLGAATFARLAGSGGAALLWWRYKLQTDDEEEDDD
jgi:hypothetical protein